jgi:hypothetical protein
MGEFGQNLVFLFVESLWYSCFDERGENKNSACFIQLNISKELLRCGPCQPRSYEFNFGPK